MEARSFEKKVHVGSTKQEASASPSSCVKMHYTTGRKKISLVSILSWCSRRKFASRTWMGRNWDNIIFGTWKDLNCPLNDWRYQMLSPRWVWSAYMGRRFVSTVLQGSTRLSCRFTRESRQKCQCFNWRICRPGSGEWSLKCTHLTDPRIYRLIIKGLRSENGQGECYEPAGVSGRAGCEGRHESNYLASYKCIYVG